MAGVYNAYSVPPYFTQGSADTTVQNAIPQGITSPANAADTPSDIAITVHIQQVILAADGLSAGARQVQVTTQSGRVTLRGTVASKEEKKKVGDLAATVVATDHVDNQIEVREIAGSVSMGGS